jgi:hypothetical protein
MRSHKLIDGVVWDGKDPKKYAASFKVMPDRLSGMEKENDMSALALKLVEAPAKAEPAPKQPVAVATERPVTIDACPQRGIPGGQSPSEQACTPPVGRGWGRAGWAIDFATWRK